MTRKAQAHQRAARRKDAARNVCHPRQCVCGARIVGYSNVTRCQICAADAREREDRLREDVIVEEYEARLASGGYVSAGPFGHRRDRLGPPEDQR